MIRNLFSTFTFRLFVLSSLGVGELYSQSATPDAGNTPNEEPVQMVIDYGGGKKNNRESHHGVVEPAGVPIGQQVAITLQFHKKRAGDQVMISLPDGGRIDVEGPVTIARDGTVAFKFQAGGTPGLHRLRIHGAQPSELMLYAFDPNRLPSPRSSRP